MKLTRLFGGASALALAQTAASVADETEIETPGATGAGPEDEDDDDGAVQPAPAAAAPAAPAAAAPPAPAAAAEPTLELTAEQATAFTAGAEARNADIADVFNARADGENGELIVAGREAAAAELLAGGLSAEATIKMLGKLPKGSAGDSMLANLRTEAGNAPNAGPGGSSEPDSAKGSWGKAFKKLGYATNEPAK